MPNRTLLIIALVCSLSLIAAARSNAPAVGTAAPIVAQLTLANQVDGVPLTQIYKAPSKGLYRASTYLETAASNTQGTVCGFISWTDDYTERGPSSDQWCTSLPGAALSGSSTFRVAANQPVNFTAWTTVPCVLPCQYSFYITLEQLQ